MYAALRLGLRSFLIALSGIILTGASAAMAVPAPPIFETIPTRPIAVAPSGKQVFIANTPAARLEVFDVTAEGLRHAGGVGVGLAPVAVAARNDREVWVVNHLSDSVSIVDVAGPHPFVKRSLAVCDEPGDIVFAGPGGNRAFVTMARRGQNCPIEGKSHTEGIGRALVMVFDGENPGAGLGGTPIKTVTLFGDTPKALAASPDGSTVYAAVFLSGNRTTSVHELTVCDGGAEAEPCKVGDKILPGGLPAPNENHAGAPAPEVGLIVHYDEASGQWQDPIGRDWSGAVRFDLPDKDVFAIDAMADVPTEKAVWSGVGTVLYSLAVNPATGDVYVANTDANNKVRFEGPGTMSTTVRGNIHRSRLTLLRESDVVPRHLNKHIDYAASPVPDGVQEKSLALPTGVAISPDGNTVYVAALGSDEIGVFDAQEVVDDSFAPDAASHIAVPGGGPVAVVTDTTGERLYALSRYANAIVTIDTATRKVIDQDAMANPEPEYIQRGRRPLYDARGTASNGEATCAGCHVAGNFDGLAWDLGNPDGDVMPNPNTIRTKEGHQAEPFHPMKGPMLTQSLRGMANAGPMHFRGDRTGVNAQPKTGADDEKGAFISFQPAFGGLLGRNEGPLSQDDIEAFAQFTLGLTYPPNPNRPLDNKLVGSAAKGKDLWGSYIQMWEIPQHQSCSGCHPVDLAQGFYGTDGITTPGVLEMFKTPHLRNIYERVGMFGMSRAPLKRGDGRYEKDVLLFNGPDWDHKGEQIRGFGYDHAGAVDSLERFMHYVLFTYPLLKTEDERTEARRAMADYMLQFETNLAPIVGQQVTISKDSTAAEKDRVNLLVERAQALYPNAFDFQARECELVASGLVNGEPREWTFVTDHSFRPTSGDGPDMGAQDLLAIAAEDGQSITFTCMAPKSTHRAGLEGHLPAKPATRQAAGASPELASIAQAGVAVP